MTVPQARLLQAEWHKLHPTARLMDLIYWFMSKGKRLWGGEDKPKQVSEEKTGPVNETMAQVLKRMGWQPPPGQ